MRSVYTPPQAAALFAGWDGEWWIAGGWAVDLYLGRSTRSHKDLDITILRRDQLRARTFLAGWDMHAGRGQGKIDTEPLRTGQFVDAEIPAIWCRRDATAPWAFELLLSSVEDEYWMFPRDKGIRLPLGDIGMQAAGGIRILRPEIVLAFKAKHDSERDQADLANVLPRLDAASRTWLRNALNAAHPEHPWLAIV